MSSRRRSAAGLTWMRPVELALADVHAADDPDQDPGRERRRQALRRGPGGDDRVAAAHGAGVGHEVDQQVARRARRGLRRSAAPSDLASSAETPKSWSVSSITTDDVAGHATVTLPTRPSPLTTGSLTSTPSLEPLLISIREYRTSRRAGEHARLDRLVGVRGSPRRRRRAGAGRRTARARAGRAERPGVRSASRSALQLVALGLGVDRVAEPAEQVAERLERLLAPSWIGASTAIAPRWTQCRPPPDDSPKYAVSRTRERTTSTASTARRRLHRLVVHAIGGSSVARP